MKCNFCQSDPCICGEAYKQVPCATLLNALKAIREELANQQVHVDITVDSLSLDQYIASNRCELKAGSFYDINMSGLEMPVQYKKWLEAHKGKTLYDVQTLLQTQENMPVFPLMLFLYLKSDMSVREKIHLFLDVLCAYGDAGYLLDNLLKTVKGDTYVEYANSALQVLTAVYNAVRDTAVQKLYDSGAWKNAEEIVKYAAGMTTTEENNRIIMEIIFMMTKFTTVRPKIDMIKEYGLTTGIADDLAPLDYALTSRLCQTTLELNAVL